MKVTVIGGGSTYTPELVKGFMDLREALALDELTLMDIHAQRLEIVGGFARRIVAAKGNPFKVTLTMNRREAIQGSTYIITQFRVGMMPARRGDEYLGKRHGLIGQETTGVGGMAKALRTIPVLMEIAQDIRELAPKALLVNFTNPSGLNTEALFRYAPDVHAVGLCNAPISMKMGFIEGLENLMGRKINDKDAQLDTLGLNHLSWFRGFTLEGENLWPQIFKYYVDQLRADPYPEWQPEMVESLGMIPNYYLQYFYNTDHKLADQEKWPPSRAEVVMQVEADLLKQYADPNLNEPPADLMKRGGAWYSTLATQVINSHFNNLGEIHILNTRHNGAVPDIPIDWVLEMPCKVDSAGIHPQLVQPLPMVSYGLVSQVKAYELLAVEAAIHGDRQAAYNALLAHPLGPKGSQVQFVLDDMLETNRAYLPQFNK